MHNLTMSDLTALESKIDSLMQKFDRQSQSSDARIQAVEDQLEKLKVCPPGEETNRTSRTLLGSNRGFGFGACSREDDEEENGRPDVRVSQALTFPDFNAVQEEFRTIKDAVQKVKLPKEIKVEESKKGIKRQDQSKAAIITNCASYTECLLKLLLTCPEDRPISEQNWNDIITVIVAQLRYLQEEKSLLLVNSSLGEGVGTLYRQFREHTSMFNAADISKLESCVQLYNASSQNQSGDRSFSRGRGAGRGRGFYRGRGPSFGYQSQQWNNNRIQQQRTNNNLIDSNAEQ